MEAEKWGDKECERIALQSTMKGLLRADAYSYMMELFVKTLKP